jgi:hypothetical protein
MLEIEFYQKANGRYPAKDFMYSLSPKTDHPYLDMAFERLEKLRERLGTAKIILTGI